MTEEERFIKVGFFSRGGLNFGMAPDFISYDDVLQELFDSALPSVIEVDSVGEEYAQMSQIRCECGGIFWPNEVFMAIQENNRFFDLFVSSCLVCNESKLFLFDISEFHEEYSVLRDDEREELKEEVNRGKEMLNTAGFHALAKAATKKDMLEEEHTKEYFDLREQFDWAGEASKILREEGLLRG